MLFGAHSLCGVGLIVHQKEIDVADVVDKERLVAGWHHVAGSLVAAITDLDITKHQQPFLSLPQRRSRYHGSPVQCSSVRSLVLEIPDRCTFGIAA